MARRTDHSRHEIRDLVLHEAHVHMADVGLPRFSSREVAKRIGYSVGTVYNVFPNVDALIAAVNTRTFSLWADELERALSLRPDDRVGALVAAYFAFARGNPELWHAIYAHRLPPGTGLSDGDRAERGRLTGIVAAEVGAATGLSGDAAEELTRSLIAVVHGHCSLEMGGSYALMGREDSRADALRRVRDALSAFPQNR